MVVGVSKVAEGLTPQKGHSLPWGGREWNSVQAAIRTLNSKYQKFMTYRLVDNIYSLYVKNNNVKMYSGNGLPHPHENASPHLIFLLILLLLHPQ
jgi:hypothetical protein